MKNQIEQQAQACTPAHPTALDGKQAPAAPPKSNWQRYLDGEWNPLRKQPDADKDDPTKCNY